MPVPGASPLVLLVEGPDDKHVVVHLCRTNTLISRLSILDKGGVSPLLAAIEAEVMAPSRVQLPGPDCRSHRRRDPPERQARSEP